MCLIPIQFATYSDKIWCDVVTKAVGHIILGRHWLYDLDVTIYECSNSYLFVHDEKKVKLAPLWPAPSPETKQTDASSSKKALTLINPNIIDKKIAKCYTIVVLIVREVTDDSQEQIPPTTVPRLEEFADAFLEKLPDSLPLMRDIYLTIDFAPGSTLPNLSYYRMNMAEYTTLKRQVNELLSKGFIKESLSPYVLLALLTPKKVLGGYALIVAPSTRSLLNTVSYSQTGWHVGHDIWSHHLLKIDLKSGY